MHVTGTFARIWNLANGAVVQHALCLLLCLTQAQGLAQAQDGGVSNVDASVDAGAEDSGASSDAGAGWLDAGSPAGSLDAGSQAGSLDAGSPGAGSLDAGSPDAGKLDAGGTAELDAGEDLPLTAACSCETNFGAGEREIHLCTGSFERDACSQFSCDNGTVRRASCPSESSVRLCCDMKSRDLYTYLYEDCTHPNCETGFRAQCQDFAGEVRAGSCDTPDAMEDPNTELGESATCSVVHASSEHRQTSGLTVGLLALGLLMRRRQRSATRHR